LQVWLGQRLSWPKLALRRMVRRWHFWVMVGIIAFIVGHIVLDGGTIQMLLAR
jgi:thiosulfate reductase cytochrome b subunit